MATSMPDDPQLEALKLPPHSLEAEQSVLGGLLLDNEAADKVGDVIAGADFYSEAHRLVYDHIIGLIADGKPADVVTVAETLSSVQRLDYIGGLAYLGALVENVPTAANIRHYATIVRERSILRQLAATAGDIADSAYNPLGRSAKEILDGAEAKILHIAEQGSRGSQVFEEIGKLLAGVVERIETLYNRDDPSAVTGVPTGFSDLDEKTSGLQPGDLVVVAGRPSMGKAQPLDARVRTRGGWKRMGDLAVGDALASVDGHPSIVTGTYPQGVRQVYRACFSDGRSTECCAEHLWRVHYRDWPASRVLSTERLMVMLQKARYRNRLWIDRHDGRFGHSEPVPVDPWLLGALLGDGTLSGTALQFSTASAEMLARMQARIDETMTVTHAGAYDYRIVRRDRGHARGVAGSQPNGIRRRLETLGLWGRGSERKFVPRCYLEAGRETRLDVLRGLLDTDGWVERWGSVRLSTASEQLANDVAELVRSIGGWCSIGSKQPHFRTPDGVRRPGKKAWVCHISHPEPRSLFLLSEKQNRLPERWQRQKRLTFAAIEPTRETSCQCIAVSHPQRLYVTDGDVVTHNTAFALNVGEHVALVTKQPVAVFSMEMGASQLALRMIGSVGRLDQHMLRTGRLAPDDWEKLTGALGRLHEAPILIDETPALNAIEVRSRARRLMKQYGKLGLVIVDYLQLMQASSSGENRATEISEISRSLKALAKELKVPVMALSQLNRSLEQRPNKRPVMSDLRESGAIEQDADVILFIYRDEVYNPESQDVGTAEIIIGKQRNGPIGTVRLTFLGEYTRFENFAKPGSY
jgi:replicative DNA helicase